MDRATDGPLTQDIPASLVLQGGPAGVTGESGPAQESGADTVRRFATGIYDLVLERGEPLFDDSLAVRDAIDARLPGRQVIAPPTGVTPFGSSARRSLMDCGTNCTSRPSRPLKTRSGSSGSSSHACRARNGARVARSSWTPTDDSTCRTRCAATAGGASQPSSGRRGHGRGRSKSAQHGALPCAVPSPTCRASRGAGGIRTMDSGMSATRSNWAATATAARRT